MHPIRIAAAVLASLSAELRYGAREMPQLVEPRIDYPRGYSRSRRSPGKPRPRRAYAHGPGSVGEYDAAMRAYLESGRTIARPSRFVQPVRNHAA